jgi:hypothetical protein
MPTLATTAGEVAITVETRRLPPAAHRNTKLPHRTNQPMHSQLIHSPCKELAAVPNQQASTVVVDIIKWAMEAWTNRCMANSNTVSSSLANNLMANSNTVNSLMVNNNTANSNTVSKAPPGPWDKDPQAFKPVALGPTKRQAVSALALVVRVQT